MIPQSGNWEHLQETHSIMGGSCRFQGLDKPPQYSDSQPAIRSVNPASRLLWCPTQLDSVWHGKEVWQGDEKEWDKEAGGILKTGQMPMFKGEIHSLDFATIIRALGLGYNYPTSVVAALWAGNAECVWSTPSPSQRCPAFRCSWEARAETQGKPLLTRFSFPMKL